MLLTIMEVGLPAVPLMSLEDAWEDQAGRQVLLHNPYFLIPVNHNNTYFCLNDPPPGVATSYKTKLPWTI